MSPGAAVSDEVKRSVLRMAGSSPALPKALEAVGLQTIAGKLDRLRSGGDIAAITLPPGPGALRSRRIKLFRQGGNDLSVEALVEGGWYGFERPLPEVLLRTVQRVPGDMFDVGANTGIYALLATQGRRDLVAHAFEPYPPVVTLLRNNIAINPSAHRIRILTEAVSDTTGTVVLYVPAQSGKAVETSCSLDSDFKSEIAQELAVATIILDDYWRRLERPAVSVLKVDTEGTEHRVLAGARELLATARPVVFYEFLPRGDAPSIEAIAEELRFVDIRLGCHEAVVGGPVVFDDQAWNHALVPEERLPEFLQILAIVGLRVTER